MEYTKGDWKLHKISSGGYLISSDTSSVAQVYDEENPEANARLIAAAPELYEACKELEQYLAHRPAKDKQLLAYQATLIKAIAKVEGGK